MNTILLAQILKIISENIFESDLRKLTREIVGNHFQHYRCITYITSDLDEQWPVMTNIPIVNIDLTDDFSQEESIDFTYFEGCAGYVVRSRPERKEDVLCALISSFTNSTNYRYNKQRYLYLPFDERDSEVSVLNIDQMFFMPHLIMATARNSNSDYFNFSLWSHNWFHGHKYDVMGIKYEIIEYWTAHKGFERIISDVYYDRTKNVHGKLVMMGLLHYPVFTIIIHEGNKTIYDGMETRLAALYVDEINGTWDAIDHPVHFWGDVHPDGTSDGILGSAMYHRADMGYAAVYQWHCEAVACSYPYAYPGVTCMVPRPNKSPGWMTVVLSFTPNTWVALCTMYIISSLFVFFIMTVREKKMTDEIQPIFSGKILFDAFYNTFRLQVEQIPRVAKQKTSLGIYIKFLNYYYFFLANCWIGGIASILTIPRFEKPINTVKDLVERYPALEWGANAVAWIEAIREADEEPDIKFIVDHYVILDDETLNKRTRTGDFAFFIERLPNGHFGMNDYIDFESINYLKLMEDFIYHANPVIVYPKGSPYQEPMDRLIFKLFDMGVIIKLETQVALERVNDRFQNLVRTSTQKPVEEETSLQIWHLEGPILIYVGGTTFSIFIFIIELCYHKIQERSSRTPVEKFDKNIALKELPYYE